MKYELYDVYDYRELLGTVDTMEEVNRLKMNEFGYCRRMLYYN